MLSSKELKQQAKDSLRGRWGQTIPMVGQVVVAGSSLLSSVHCS